MSLRRILIANRSEIAIRIARAADALGLQTVAVYSADDARSLHVRAASAAVALSGEGPGAYLAVEALARAAIDSDCDAVHPGYGFLSENASFARLCAARGLTFIGPSPDALDQFGDKLKAKALAASAGVPVLAGVSGGVGVEGAKAFLASLGPGGAVMVKAVAGGGGRGIRLVSDPSQMQAAFTACAAEALAAFGSGEIYVERLVRRARHIEVQILGDSTGRVIQLGERDCSLQRGRQKVLEIAPAPHLHPELRARLLEAAVRLGEAARYDSVGTIEFLVDRDAAPDDPHAFAFMEANPRLQVEHTVTEAVTGVDLASTQIQLAAGKSLADLGLDRDVPTRGVALQLRINAETLEPDGGVRPASGVIAAFDPPSGPGVRVDTAGYVGYKLNPRFDSLLAKLIVHSDDETGVLRKGLRALSEFRIEGVATNAALLAQILSRPELAGWDIDTRWIEVHLPALLAGDPLPPRYFAAEAQEAKTQGHAAAPEGMVAAKAPMGALLVSLDVAVGERVRKGQTIAVCEAMKMQHLVLSPSSGWVRAVLAGVRQGVDEGQAILFIEPDGEADEADEHATAIDLDAIRPDLAEVYARHALTLDANRPDAVARRHASGKRTARENLNDLFDGGQFIEYGALAIAAQRRRRSVDDLMRNTPADGLVGGIGAVNGAAFGEEAAQCLGLSYDYTVLAGTQGLINHKKTDRLLAVAEQLTLPIVFFTEGGGGRPGDVDAVGVTGLDTHSFYAFAKLSGMAPRIGVATGRCFAGNAVFLGCCDVIIATEGANIGLGGPAMIEGGGLGVFKPEDIGPTDAQTANGVIDILVEDEAAAVRSAKTVLSYFQGRLPPGEVADQRLLRAVIPDNRLRVYDVRRAIEGLADVGSFTELRQGFARNMVTGLIRVGGRPMGLIANDCRHLGGAIDSDASDKAARFMQLCDAFGLPILSLCDTPGFMVGPEAEKTASVRHGSRLFVVAAGLSVPIFTVVLRKGYGLGAQAMAGGSLQTSAFTVSWPTGEFGGMGLEGAVRLGFRKELEAVEDPVARQALFDDHVRASYARGKAVSVAQYIEIDAVIDPVETRAWILRGLAARRRDRELQRRRYIDPW
jgi:acetyl/propionyl-CoA carboxylase alpha subunit/acetyl-CoA carboxylase carboxyltransferase component